MHELETFPRKGGTIQRTICYDGSHSIHHILPISHQIAVIYRGRLLTRVNRGDHNATEIENLIMHGVPVLEEAMEGI